MADVLDVQISKEYNIHFSFNYDVLFFTFNYIYSLYYH